MRRASWGSIVIGCSSAIWLACGGDDDGATVDAAAVPDAAVADAAPQIDATPPPDAAPQIDAGPPADAGPADFSCIGAPSPTTAPAMLTYAGIAAQNTGPGTMVPVMGAVVEVRRRTDDMLLGTATTGADGLFSIAFASGGVPVPVYVHASEATFLDTYSYPPDPMAEDITGIQIPMFTPTQILLFEGLLGIDIDDALGQATIVAVDCNGTPIEGATITLDPPAGETAYIGVSGLPSTDAPSTDDQGVGLLFNIPVGAVDVTADVDGTALETHTVDSVGGAFFITQIHP